MNIGVHVSFSIMVSSRYMPSNGIAGSYSSFVPSFLRNLHTVLHSGYINLYSHQQCKRVPFSLHPLSILFFIAEQNPFVYIKVHLPYPFLCQWTFRLLPCYGYYKQCHNEDWKACTILNYGFLQIHTQEWGFRIILIALILVF